MHTKTFELRIQSLVNADQLRNKQIALKVKTLNKKFNQLCTSQESIQNDLIENMRAIEALNEKTAEYQELLDARKAEHIRIKQQVHRLRKRIDAMNALPTSCKLRNTDRIIYFKKLFKLAFLREITKVHFEETKTTTRSHIKGYIASSDDIYPFEKKCATVEDITETLWENISINSCHSSEWNRLFGFDDHNETTNS